MRETSYLPSQIPTQLPDAPDLSRLEGEAEKLGTQFRHEVDKLSGREGAGQAGSPPAQTTVTETVTATPEPTPSTTQQTHDPQPEDTDSSSPIPGVAVIILILIGWIILSRTVAALGKFIVAAIACLGILVAAIVLF